MRASSRSRTGIEDGFDTSSTPGDTLVGGFPQGAPHPLDQLAYTLSASDVLFERLWADTRLLDGTGPAVTPGPLPWDVAR
jgi:hypothetical protein